MEEEEMKEAEKLLVSQFPIFVVAKQPIALGINIIDREKANSNWSINVSSLEEFVSKQLVFENKMEEFKTTYKDPAEFLCLFVLSDLGAQYMFLPRG